MLYSGVPPILHLTHTDISEDQRIIRAIKAGTDQGFSVYSLGFAEKIAYPEVSRSLNSVIVVRPKFLVPPSTKGPLLSFFTRIYEPFRKTNYLLWMYVKSLRFIISTKPELIHVHDYLLLPVAALGSKIINSQLIYDAHELESKRIHDSAFKSKLVFALEKYCWGQIDGFVTVSESISNWYFSRFGSPRATVVLNSPENIKRKVNYSLSTKKSLREDTFSSENELIFVFVGNLGEGNGIHKMIEVFSNKPSAKLAIVGQGENKEQIVNLCASHQNIFVLPSVPHDTLLDYISSADYGLCLTENLCLSYYFALPNKIFEYIQSGLNIICTDFPEMSQIVHNQNIGFTVGEDIDSISELIDKLLTKPRPEKINTESFAKYSWHFQQIKLTDLYKSLLSKKQSDYAS